MTIEQAVVVVPAHDEAKVLPRCLKAILTAAAGLPAPVLVVVVLDACADESASLAGQFGADVVFVEVDARNVGATRAAGFLHARTTGGGDSPDESRTWYATTDADSRVDADWLTRQVSADADMVLGVVRVTNWRHFRQRPCGAIWPPTVRRRVAGDLVAATVTCTARTWGFGPTPTGRSAASRR